MDLSPSTLRENQSAPGLKRRMSFVVAGLILEGGVKLKPRAPRTDTGTEGLYVLSSEDVLFKRTPGIPENTTTDVFYGITTYPGMMDGF